MGIFSDVFKYQRSLAPNHVWETLSSSANKLLTQKCDSNIQQKEHKSTAFFVQLRSMVVVYLLTQFIQFNSIQLLRELKYPLIPVVEPRS